MRESFTVSGPEGEIITHEAGNMVEVYDNLERVGLCSPADKQRRMAGRGSPVHGHSKFLSRAQRRTMAEQFRRSNYSAVSPR
jgi:hypothetical protein